MDAESTLPRPLHVLVDIYLRHRSGTGADAGLPWSDIKPEWTARGLTLRDFEHLILTLISDGLLEGHTGRYIFTPLAAERGIITPPVWEPVEKEIVRCVFDAAEHGEPNLDVKRLMQLMGERGFSPRYCERGTEMLIRRGIIMRRPGGIGLTDQGRGANIPLL